LRVESVQRNGWRIEFDGFVKLLFARVGED